MLNPLDANAELHARLFDILLKAKLSGLFDQQEMAALCYATGVQIDSTAPPWKRETRLERLQRLAREAEELKSVQRIGPPRFPETSCSQCGGSFGPGDHGYSDCRDHGGSRYGY